MKISEMIKALEEAKSEHGDMEVCVFDPEAMEDSELTATEAYITFSEDKNGKVENVTLCDRETMLSFL